MKIWWPHAPLLLSTGAASCGSDLSQKIWTLHQSILKTTAMNEASFLVFDFSPRSLDITMATSFVCKQMSYSRFQTSMRRLLQVPPLSLSDKEAAAQSTYGLRKLMPTIGGLLHLKAEERASLSNWKDVTQDKEASLAAKAMGSRYDCSKMIQAAQVKVECMAAMKTASSSADSYDLSFESLSGHIPSRTSLVSFWKCSGVGLQDDEGPANPASTSLFPIKLSECKRIKASKAPELSPASKSSENSDNPSSSGEERSESEVGEPNCKDINSLSTQVFIVPGKYQQGKIHMVSDQGMVYYCYCGKKVSITATSYVGFSSAICSPNEWCHACKKHLPESLIPWLEA